MANIFNNNMPKPGSQASDSYILFIKETRTSE